MSEITSGSLLAALDHKIIQEQFEIVRPTINGLVALASFGTPVQPYEGSKISWLDMSVGADSDVTTAESLAADTTVDVSDGTLFRSGMVLNAGEEILVVESVAGNVLTVQRGVGGTTAATIASGDTLSIESIGREENSLAATDGIYQPDDVENYFQTMDTAVEMSRRALATLQYGNTNDLAFQVNERTRQLLIQMDKILIRGRKMELTIAGKKVSYTGGLGFFFDQAGAIDVTHGGAALTLDAINALNAEIKARGGMADSIVMGIKQARALQALVNAKYGSQRLSEFVSDEGGLTTLPTDLPQIGGVNKIVIDTNLKDSEIYLVSSSRMTIVPMAQGNADESGAWQTKDATLPGQDGQKVRILGDFAMELRDTKTHFARLTNIA
jgi:hypothetical protein